MQTNARQHPDTLPEAARTDTIAIPVIRPMALTDYDAMMAMWHATPGISVRDADSPEATARYLERNPGLSFVAIDGDQLVGCVMAGHDGRRGYLQHLVVAAPYRRAGTGAALVERSLAALAAEGILKTHLDVLTTNDAGAHYWRARGWQHRTDIIRFSMIRGDNPNV